MSRSIVQSFAQTSLAAKSLLKRGGDGPAAMRSRRAMLHSAVSPASLSKNGKVEECSRDPACVADDPRFQQRPTSRGEVFERRRPD